MSILREAIKQELLDLIPVSVKLSEDIDTAKTTYKRNYLKKKLVKNNQKIADLSLALDKIPEEEKEDERD